MSARAFCPRCQQEVDVVRAWSGFLWAKRVWFACLGLVMLVMPILMSEITLLLPLAMLFAMAGGPLFFLSNQGTTCAQCGAEIPRRASKRSASR